MEKELNIAAILKDKPNAKLWSPAIGECSFRNITLDGFVLVKANSVIEYWFSTDGRLYREGECLLFPSKEMQDWSKFTWKKGDVLSCGVDSLCIFNKWGNDEYTKFDAEYATPNYSGAMLKTKDWIKVTNENTIKQYISKIEEINGGKLNLETLEIEKPKQEFKDGDILHCNETKYSVEHIFIAKMHGEAIGSYAFLVTHNYKLYIKDADYDESELSEIRPATDSEKQQLFSALEKEGKRWNPDTKQIEDLSKKCDFEPYQKVMVRDSKEERWRPAFFWRELPKDSEYVILSGGVYNYCIPYNEETKHLLGTTDDWEGGEG